MPREGNEKLLVFFKIRPEVITLENLHENVFVSSMVDSPVSTLYHTIQKVFAPVLLKVRVCHTIYLTFECEFDFRYLLKYLIYFFLVLLYILDMDVRITERQGRQRSERKWQHIFCLIVNFIPDELLREFLCGYGILACHLT